MVGINGSALPVDVSTADRGDYPRKVFNCMSEPDETQLSMPTLPNGISSQYIDKIAPAISKAQGEIKDAELNAIGKASATASYEYANLHSIYEVAREVIANNQLAVINRFAPNNMVHIFLLHASGQWIDYGEYPLGNPAEHKARGGALTYVRRFSLKAIFGIADADDDKEDDRADQALGKENPIPVIAPDPKPEYRPKDTLRPYKDEYVIPVPVKLDGSLDLDNFAADLESEINSAADGNKLSLLNRANSKTLRIMEKERPDLFESIGQSFRQMSQALM